MVVIEDDIDGLMTCPFCYKWLGAYHRKEDCPRIKEDS